MAACWTRFKIRPFESINRISQFDKKPFNKYTYTFFYSLNKFKIFIEISVQKDSNEQVYDIYVQ